MVERQVSEDLLVFRRFIRRCMLAKNLKGSSPETVRAELSDCSRRFRNAVQAVNGASDQQLQEMAEQAARDFLNSSRR